MAQEGALILKLTDELSTSILQQAKTYRVDCLYLGRAHYKAAERADHWHRRLGVSSALLSAVIGTAIFATIEKSAETPWRIAAGLLLLLASLLASTQSFYGFADRASEHRSAGGAYGALRRDFDLFLLAFPSPDLDRAALEALTRHKNRLDELGTTSPLIPPVPIAAHGEKFPRRRKTKTERRSR